MTENLQAASESGVGLSDFLGDSSIDHQAMKMRRTRENLQLGDNFAMAIAMFPLRVANMANDLRRILELQQTVDGSPESKAVVGYIVDRIKQEYRDTFGSEIGA